MGYIQTGFTPEQESHVITSIDKMTKWQEAEEKRRKTR
jgi:hypothetical protein